MFTRDPNPHPHPRPLPAPAHATSTRDILDILAATLTIGGYCSFVSLFVVFLDQNIKHKEANKEWTPNPTPSRLLKARKLF